MSFLMHVEYAGESLPIKTGSNIADLVGNKIANYTVLDSLLYESEQCVRAVHSVLCTRPGGCLDTVKGKYPTTA
jgi:hypothetical protein